MRLVAVIVALGLSAVAVAVAPALGSGSTPSQAKPARLSAADRATLAREPSTRRRIVLVGRVGRGDEIADAVRARGGAVRTADDRAGVVLAELPAAGALALQGTPGLKAIAVDRKVRRPTDTALRPARARVTQTPRPEPINPYLPSGDIGAPQFVQTHPAYDGRSVRIAVVDGLADWTAPGMGTTTTGEPKVTRAYQLDSDLIVVTDRVVPVTAGRFEVDGQEYRLPSGVAAQRVRFGVLRESLAGDVNVDRDRADAFAIAVLGGQQPVAYVDTDQDRSFEGETRLADWNTTHATATLGSDRPDTEPVEVLSFGLNACQETGLGACPAPAGRRGDAWSFVTGSRGTWWASVAAGHDFRLGGGRFDGVAPGAEVWGFDPFGPDRTLWGSDFAAAALLAAQEGADVIDIAATLTPSVFFPGGEDVLSPLVDNLVDAYGVTVVAPVCCNVGLGINVVSPQAARDAILAGQSVGPDTYAAVFGRPGIRGERQHYFTPRGLHATNGRPQPDVVAPAVSLVTTPQWDTATGPLSDVLPPGYYVHNHALAHAQVTGAVAILISAARAEGVPVTPHAVKRALELGARPLRGGLAYGPAEVGHGLVQLDRAWGWLRRLARDESLLGRELTTSVAADVASGTGDGIYQRATVRETEDVTVTTRETTARTYDLRADQPWIHLDRATLELPAAGTGSFSVTIDPAVRAQPGEHVGTVTLDDPGTIDPADHEMRVTIVTPLTFDAAHRVHVADSLEAEAAEELFVAVPPGTRSLVLQLTRPVTARAGVDLYYHQNQGLFLIDDPAQGRTTMEIVSNPEPGVLGVVLHAHETDRPAEEPVVPRHPYDLTITALPGEPPGRIAARAGRRGTPVGH
jgi:hypothetical protein